MATAPAVGESLQRCTRPWGNARSDHVRNRLAVLSHGLRALLHINDQRGDGAPLVPTGSGLAAFGVDRLRLR